MKKSRKIRIEKSAAEPVTDYAELHLQRMAARLAMIVENEKIPETIRDAVFVIAENAVLNVSDSESRVEFIENRFVKAMKATEPAYAEAVMQSLMSVMEYCIAEDLYQPILDKSLGREANQ